MVFRVFVFILLLLCFGCEPETLQETNFEEDEIGTEESALSSYHYIQMIQKGAFDNTMFFTPKKLLWGLVKKPYDPWESPQYVNITYTKSGSKMINKPVKIKIPKNKLKEGYIVAYKLVMERVNPIWNKIDTHYTSERFIKNPLSVTTGKMIVLPIKSWSCYAGDFYDWNYQISVYDDAIENCSYFYGKPISYFWGLTTIDEDTYKTKGPEINFDFPWYDNTGQPVLDGWDDTFSFVHNGKYKGCYRTNEAIVWVPSGWKLLFKLKFAKYWNYKVVETPDTKAFYLDPSGETPKCIYPENI